MTPEFLALLRSARERRDRAGLPGVIALARDLNLKPNRMSDVLSGRSRYSLGVQACLRLAVSEGLIASDVLRKAGHEAEASLLEQLTGAVEKLDLTPAQRRLLRAAQGLSADDLDHLAATARRFKRPARPKARR